MFRHIQPIQCLVLAAVALPAAAQSPERVTAPEVVIRGTVAPAPVREAKPVDTLGDEELRRSMATTLGETVSQMPGTHNASFGPAVGIPVIRGMTGSRVRIAIDGIGTHDASSLSPDHAVTVEPMLAEEVRVMRGPETVRYGSGAIGGAVEISDGRIQTRRLRKPVEAQVQSRYGTNGHERASAAKIRGGAGPLILHVDAFHRERGNLGIPGIAIDEAAVLQQFGTATGRNTNEFVASTDMRNHGAGVGLSYVGERLNLGFSLGSMENNYGVPPGAHSNDTTVLLDPSLIEGQNVRIDMQQTRADLKGELKVGLPLLKSLRLRAGDVNYRHDEVDNSRPVTVFRTKAREYRLEGDHSFRADHQGTLGLHYIDREVSALGQEAFLPRAVATTQAAFLSEKYEARHWALEGAVRAENQEILPDPIVRGLNTFVFPRTQYRPTTWSVAVSAKFGPKSRLTATLSQPERAPDVQELYSLGPHLATRTYNIGNRNLGVESMQRMDLGFTHEWRTGLLRLNAFRYEADGFIYLRSRGTFYDLDRRRIISACVRPERCLPVLQYSQQDAVFNGYEAEWLMRFGDSPFGAMEVTLFTDAVRGRFQDAGAGDVPRLPPRRTGFELAHFAEAGWVSRLRWTYASAQKNPGVNETGTAGYHLVNLSIDRTLEPMGGVEWTVFLNARNLLDEEIRNSVSFLRNFAPEAGRRIEVGLKATF